MSTVEAPMTPRGVAPIERRYDAARALGRRLGDPRQPHSPLGFEAAAARDRQGRYPDELADVARDAGLHLSILPRRWGGTLDGFDRTLILARVAATRDLAVMPATMFSISALSSLLAEGCEPQIELAAAIVRRGGAVAYALSEEDAGSDLLSSSCRLERVGGQLRLTGRKWMVGLGDRCEALYVLARTGERGPGAFTALLLDRAKLPPDCVHVSSPATVDGMRGIGFSSYCFDACPVPEDAVAGRWGHGLEAAMKAQQLVRMMSAAGCLAAADSALRVTLDFAVARRIGAEPLLSEPLARAEAARAFAALAAADTIALVAARAAHADPASFSVAAAVAKRIATELCAASIAHAGAVLGARSLITDGPAGVFAKMRRDCAVVSYIDTSPVANLRALAMQLPMLARRHGAAPDRARGSMAHNGDRTLAFSLGADLPEADPQGLRLHGSGQDLVLSELRTSGVAILDTLAVSRTARLTRELLNALEDVWEALGCAPPQLELAERFCYLHAAAGCLLVWWYNRHEWLFGEPPGSESWLQAALAYLLARAGGRLAPDAADVMPALPTALSAHARDRVFGVVPVALFGCADHEEDEQ